MPLHIQGLDESAFKTLAKRYRAVLAKKTPDTVPSLMQVQEDLARAMGHKDLHAAQAYWASQADAQEDVADERDAMVHHHRRANRLLESKRPAWNAAIAAMEDPATFRAWLSNHALDVLDMRERFRSPFNLLLHAATHDHGHAVEQLLAIGDQVHMNDLCQLCGMDEHGGHKRKVKVPAPDPAHVSRLIAAMSPEVAAKALFDLGMGYGRVLHHPLFPTHYEALFERSGALIDEHTLRAVAALSGKEASVLFERVVSAAQSDAAVALVLVQEGAMRGFKDGAQSVSGRLLEAGRVEDLRRILATAGSDAFDQLEATRNPKPGKNYYDELRGKSYRAAYHEELLLAASALGNHTAVDWALEQPMSQEALGKAVCMAASAGHLDIAARCKQLGGAADPQAIEHAVRHVASSFARNGVDGTLARLDALLADHPQGYQIRFYGGGNLIGALMHADIGAHREAVVALVGQLRRRGVEINDREDGHATAQALLEHVERAQRDPKELLATVELLLDIGLDPSIARRGGQPLLGRVLPLIEEVSEAEALVRRMCAMPRVLDRIPEQRHPLSCITSVEQGELLLACGATLTEADAAQYVRRFKERVAHDQDASHGYEKELLAWALGKGVDCTKQMKAGSTLLHLAASYDATLPLLDLMLVHGADPAAVDEKGRAITDLGSERVKALVQMRQLPRMRPR